MTPINYVQIIRNKKEECFIPINRLQAIEFNYSDEMILLTNTIGTIRKPLSNIVINFDNIEYKLLTKSIRIRGSEQYTLDMYNEYNEFVNKQIQIIKYTLIQPQTSWVNIHSNEGLLILDWTKLNSIPID